MSKPWSILLSLFATIPFLAAESFAQVPTDSLGGKTVHVYLPSQTIDTLMIQNMNATMTKGAQYWYSYTFTRAGLYDYEDGFYFTDLSHRRFLSKSGLGGAEAPRFLVADFQGAKELWIIVDPTGSIDAPPVLRTQAPKQVNILNPWPATAPKLISGNKTRNMTTVPGHCGWFAAMLLDTAMTKGYFSEIRNPDTYGKSGFSGTDDFDFSALFAQYGPTLWLNTGTHSWTGSFPNVEGTCQYWLAMTVRDFSRAHPDFDFGSLTGDHSVKGVVMPDIGPEPGRKPVLNPANTGADPAISFSRFDQWWATDSTRAAPFGNYESCYDLPLSKSSDGQWEYDSYSDSPDHGFWPAEGAGLNRFNETTASCYVMPPPDSTSWVTGGPRRNGNFCTESHAAFTYAPGQQFAFRGENDVWVFINDKLVIDLGGVHVPMAGSIDLDKLGLTAGKTYKWDFFQCNRQPCASALRIKTSIYFKQLHSLYGIEKSGPAPGPFTLEIWKQGGGTGSCASIGTRSDTLKAANLTYQLLDATGKSIKELASGNTYFGGITIAEPVISVDTAKLTLDSGLVAGAEYRVVAFEAANPTLQVGVSFRTRSASTGLRRVANPKGRSRPAARYRNVLGRRVPALSAGAHTPLVPQKNPAPGAP